MLAPIAEIFRRAHGDESRLAAGERRFVGRRGDDHAAGKARFGPEIILDKFLHFAAAFADQTNDDDISLGIARKHGEQDRFPHARAREDAHALAFAAGGKGIERPDAKIELAPDAATLMRRRRRSAERIGLHPLI